MRCIKVKRGRFGLRSFGVVTLVAAVALPAAAAGAQSDPREGLGAGFLDAESAIYGLEHVGMFEKPDGTFFDPNNLGSGSFFDSDLAFQGDRTYMGNYRGFQIFDTSDPSSPTLLTEVVCPGGQGDVSVYGDLLFRSVEGSNGRWDCGTEGNSGDTTEATKLRGIQVWDISDTSNPLQLTAVPLCRGSHTHSVVEDPNDPSTVYVYNSGTSSTQSTDAISCNNVAPDGDNPSRWKTEIIAVPLDAPETAAVVNEARLFTDITTGAINGLETQTDACHDITAYPEIGLAAGACEGNGILIDISDPANPFRIDAVADNENFAYWHSATFSNDGSKVVFTDEWGGGGGARCRAGDPIEWGANAIFDIVDDGSGPTMEFRSYHKLPAVQTSTENCVAHNGSLLPVPGRDILVQAWYQGGISLMDFTDSSNPYEIAYFDRGPIDPNSLVLGGFWSAYWYDGAIIGSEIARGLDAFTLTETPMMSAREIAAAESVGQQEVNVQGQRMLTWAPSTAVVGSYMDQLERSGDLALLDDIRVDQIEHFLRRADAATRPEQYAAAAQLGEDVLPWLSDPVFDELSAAIEDLVEVLAARGESTIVDPRPPFARGLIGPLQFAVESRESVVVGESFAGLLTSNSDGMSDVVVAVPNGSVSGVDLANDGTYFTSAEFDSNGALTGTKLSFTRRNSVKVLADLLTYEQTTNPDAGVEYGFVGITDECAQQLPSDFGPATYTGIVDSNPHSVVVQRKTAYVADAAANAILEVAPNGDVSTLAVLPTHPLPVDAAGAAAFGLPDCVVGLSYHFEPVPTDVELGPNNWLYVTTLPGGPEDPGFPARGELWRIHLVTGEMERLADGLAGATNLAIGPNGTVWVTELFGGQVSKIVRGEAQPYAELPSPAAIEYFNGLLYVAYDVFAEGKITTITR